MECYCRIPYKERCMTTLAVYLVMASAISIDDGMLLPHSIQGKVHDYTSCLPSDGISHLYWRWNVTTSFHTTKASSLQYLFTLWWHQPSLLTMECYCRIPYKERCMTTLAVYLVMASAISIDDGMLRPHSIQRKPHHYSTCLPSDDISHLYWR